MAGISNFSKHALGRINQGRQESGNCDVVLSHCCSQSPASNIQDIGLFRPQVGNQRANKEAEAEAFSTTILEPVVEFGIEHIFQVVYELVDCS